MTIPGFATSNTQAQNSAALLAHLQANGGHAEIDPGVYQCALSFTDMDVDIRGSGENNTLLQSTGAHGISFDNSASVRMVSIDNLSLQTNDLTPAFSAVNAVGRTWGPGNVTKQLDIGRVAFVGANVEATHASWRSSVHLHNICNGQIHNIWSRVDGGTPAAHIEMTGQNLNNVVSDASFYGDCEAAVRATGSQNEGLLLSNIVVLSAEHGVKWSGGGVFLTIIGSHFDTAQTAVLSDVSQAKIVGNLFYAARSNNMRLLSMTLGNHTITGNTFLQTGSVSGAWGINLSNATLCTITGNSFERLNGGVVVTGPGCGQLTISGNSLVTCATDIYLGPGTTNCFTMGNTGNGTTHYADASGNSTNAFVGKAFGSKTIHLS